MEVYIKYLNGNSELIEDVEIVKENSRMGYIEVTYKERVRIFTDEGTHLDTEKTYRKILNIAAIESIEILQEK